MIIVVEVRRGGEGKEERRREEKRREGGATTDIKSNNPHLAGGEKLYVHGRYHPLIIDLRMVYYCFSDMRGVIFYWVTTGYHSVQQSAATMTS